MTLINYVASSILSDMVDREEVGTHGASSFLMLYLSFLMLLINIFNSRNNSTESPDDICPGFMADPRHLSGHFEYITESPALNKAIGENFRSFMGNSDKAVLRLFVTLFCRTSGDLPEGR